VKKTLAARVSFETSFDSKQRETKRLFRLFRFYTETESFDVSIELKQTEDQPKQFDREHILVFFSENFGFFWFVSVCFGLFRNSLFQLFRFFNETESSMFRLNRNKQKTNRNRLIFCYFSENLGLFRLILKQFCLFQLFRYRFETQKQTKIFSFWFYKTNRNRSCFGWNRFFFGFEDTLLAVTILQALVFWRALLWNK
jgi:hypothetical protein